MKQTVLITGGNSGLGYECAKVLAKSGEWHIAIASRNLGRVETAVQQLQQETRQTAISSHTLDLADLTSVRHFANEFEQAGLPPLTAVVCNAGLSPGKNSTTADGIDTIFGVNHLGHYLLVHLLAKQMSQPGRVIFVSSGTHIPEHKLARRTGVPKPKYVKAAYLAHQDQAPKEAYIGSTMQRYSTSKLCNVLATYEFSRQFETADIDLSVYAIDPGLMPGTGLVRDFPKPIADLFTGAVRFASRWVDGIRFPETSGEHLARLVTDEGLNGRSALYFDGDKEARSSADSYDRAKAVDLWNTSSELCKLTSQETMLPLTLTL